MLTSTAISQKGFMLIFTFVISTPLCDAQSSFIAFIYIWYVRLLFCERTLGNMARWCGGRSMVYLILLDSDACVVVYDTFNSDQNLLHLLSLLAWA